MECFINFCNLFLYISAYLSPFSIGKLSMSFLTPLIIKFNEVTVKSQYIW